MAIALDTATTATWAWPTASWNHICSWSDRFLYIIINYNIVNYNPTAATYDGVPMILVMDRKYGLFDRRTQVYTLVNPSSGSNTVSVSLWDVSGGRTGWSVSYVGVDQVVWYEVDTTGGNISTSGTINLSVTTITDNDLVIDAIGSDPWGGSPNISWPQIAAVDLAWGSWERIVMTYDWPITPPALVQFSYDLGIFNTRCGRWMGALKPSSIPSNIKSVSGVLYDTDIKSVSSVLVADIKEVWWVVS